jgi:predicted secreted Zn-dependent protease
VEDKVVHYSIAGSTADELRKQMQALGPDDPVTGEKGFGYTRAEFHWSDRYESDAGVCRLTEVTVEMTIVETLPEWNPASQASGRLAKKWSTFLAHLVEHENGHRQIAIEEAMAVHDAIQDVQPQSDCHELQRQVSHAIERIERKADRENAGYDRSTNHGETQGAVF